MGHLPKRTVGVPLQPQQRQRQVGQHAHAVHIFVVADFVHFPAIAVGGFAIVAAVFPRYPLASNDSNLYIISYKKEASLGCFFFYKVLLCGECCSHPKQCVICAVLTSFRLALGAIDLLYFQVFKYKQVVV